MHTQTSNDKLGSLPPEIARGHILSKIETDHFLPENGFWMQCSGIVLVIFTGSLIIASAFIQYNVTVKSAAKLRPAGEQLFVQPNITGVVQKIWVNEYQQVQKGDLIATLDSSQQEIQQEKIIQQLEILNQKIDQVDSQKSLLNRQSRTLSYRIQTNVNAVYQELLQAKQIQKEKESNITSELISAQRQLDDISSSLQKGKQEVSSTNRELQRFQKLAKEGAIAKREVEKLRDKLNQAILEVDSQKNKLAYAKDQLKTLESIPNPSLAAIDVVHERLNLEKKRGIEELQKMEQEYKELILKKINFEAQVSELEQNLKQIDKQISQAEIRATENGVIQQIKVRNSGQVISSGETIALLSPIKSTLVLKTYIESNDISKIEKGQSATIKIHACPYPDYGILGGKVTAIAPDTLVNQKTSDTQNATSLYEVLIEPEALHVGSSHHQCLLRAGMEAQTSIITRQDTILRFFLRKARLVFDV